MPMGTDLFHILQTLQTVTLVSLRYSARRMVCAGFSCVSPSKSMSERTVPYEAPKPWGLSVMGNIRTKDKIGRAYRSCVSLQFSGLHSDRDRTG